MKYALLVFCVASQIYGATAEKTETRSVEPGTILEVQNQNGDITVTGWQGDKVEISILKITNESAEELEKVTYEIITGKVLMVKTKFLDEDAKVSVMFKIRVPAHVRVGQLETANGDIELTGTTGDAVLNSANGDILARDNKGTLRAATSNGDITVKGFNTIYEANTSNGTIMAELTAVPKNGMQISTANGSIMLYIAPDLDCDITASTANGRVSVKDVNLILRTKDQRTLTGSFGDGGPLVDVVTSNGGITILRLED